MKTINILKKIGLFGSGLLLSANINAQTLHGTVKLASDGVTPVKKAQVKLWWKYKTGSASDTIHLTTDTNGEYTYNPFRIRRDPDTTVTTIPGIKSNQTIENILITNNPGQEHKFIFLNKTEPKKRGEIYNLNGQKIATVKEYFENGKVISSWNGKTNQGLAQEGVYIFSQILENGERKTKEFIQINDGTQSNYSLEKKINETKEKRFDKPIEKRSKSLDQATYIFELHSVQETNPNFINKTDTIIFSPVDNVNDFYANHLVEGIIPNYRNMRVIIREDYDTLRLENVMVKMRDVNSGSIIDSSLTDSNGVAVIKHIPLGTVFKLEYGNEPSLNNRPDYFSRIDNETIDSITGTNVVFADTIDSVVRQRTLPKKWLTVPKRAGETGTADSVNIGGHANWLSEILTDSVNIEAAKGRDINVFLAVDDAYWQEHAVSDYIEYGDSLFFPTNADEPWNYVTTQPNITPTMEANYDEDTNYYAGQLGVTLDQDSAEYVDQKEGTLNDGKTGIIGSKTNLEMTYNNTDLFPTNFFMKQFGLKTGPLPSGRSAPGFNYQGPNLIDRSLFWIVYKHKQNIYKNNIDTEDYRNVQENL